MVLIPPHRIPVRIARGDLVDLEQARDVGELHEGEAVFARDQDALYVLENVGGALELTKIGGSSGATQIATTPPVAAVPGSSYFNPTTNQLFVSIPNPAVPGALQWSPAGGGTKVIVSDTQPALPDINHLGTLWFDTSRNGLLVAIEQPPGSGMVIWDPAAGPTAAGGVIITPTMPPGTHAAGTFWFDSAHGELFIWYDDSNTQQWVSANAIGGHGAAVHQIPVHVGDTPPPTPQEGDLWFEAASATLYVYYDQGGTPNWVQSVPVAQPAIQSAMVYCGDVAPANPILGGLWWDSTTGTLYVYYADGTNPPAWVAANPITQTHAAGGGGGAATGVTQNVSIGRPPDEVILQIVDGLIVNVIA
jgi:hypothetical protein